MTMNLCAGPAIEFCILTTIGLLAAISFAQKMKRSFGRYLQLHKRGEENAQ